MVLPVDWSLEAARDVEGIKDYIRRDSEFYARVVVEKIIDVGRKIEKFPKAGRIVPSSKTRGSGSGLFIATGSSTSSVKTGSSFSQSSTASSS